MPAGGARADFVESRLVLEWRRYLTARLMAGYYADRAFFRLHQQAGLLDNPDQARSPGARRTPRSSPAPGGCRTPQTAVHASVLVHAPLNPGMYLVGLANSAARGAPQHSAKMPAAGVAGRWRSRPGPVHGRRSPAP